LSPKEIALILTDALAGLREESIDTCIIGLYLAAANASHAMNIPEEIAHQMVADCYRTLNRMIESSAMH